jgi:transketolase
MMNPGKDVTLIATGHLVWTAIQTAEILEKEGISVELINIHTIKPLDVNAIIESAKKTGAVVVAEEHVINGGLGESVAQVLSQNLPTPMEFVAVNDKFGESGTADELMKKFHLDTSDVVEAVKRVMSRK